ncbi:GNAT family N-acetyltransferase [Reinekea marinisedimentorum]|uniref:Ribosomal protein S18 acetylase RimI-like enzyme n=1 Tax=Reinekea marinisedimentorum TaxID=230495 RepID=A0A4R3IB39_9GAMM|nr:N-acetyltransferase [Reinekea marinisedimentorum]TCS43671.1 ribosomal protein S18 acetylase RimI-like enzyme [Reinekea marinisedimentorum]
MQEVQIRPVTMADLDRCFEIETLGYGGDEAASREKIAKRIETYPQGFIVLEQAGEVAGFINGGATDSVQLSDEEFKELIGHDPAGRHIVIMSVVVDPAFQRRGYAQQLMHEYIRRMKHMQKASIYLICQTGLIGFYQSFGYQDLGPSDSDHGGLSWQEMRLAL